MMECRVIVGEGNGIPLQYSCLENPMDGGAWWAVVCGVTQSWTGLKWLSSSSSRVIVKIIHIKLKNIWRRKKCAWTLLYIFVSKKWYILAIIIEAIMLRITKYMWRIHYSSHTMWHLLNIGKHVVWQNLVCLFTTIISQDFKQSEPLNECFVNSLSAWQLLFFSEWAFYIFLFLLFEITWKYLVKVFNQQSIKKLHFSG